MIRVKKLYNYLLNFFTKMELNQAASTFLLFFFVFLISLIGFVFFINNNKKLPELSLVYAIQTSILLVGFFTLLIFGASYYFVLSDVDPTKQPLKDALSITASFFGGFATLIAAYIATKLFNDWRVQSKFQLLKEKIDLANEIINEISDDDLYVITDKKFKNLESLKKSFYVLYETVIIIDLKNADFARYKELHLEVSEIIMNLLIDGNRPLDSKEITKVMNYRGEIWALKTVLANKINEVLN